MSDFGLSSIIGEDPEAFADLLDSAFYPGSKQRRGHGHHEPKANQVAERFAHLTPRVYQVKGEDVQFYTIGQLASALDRSAVTIRKWEHDGVIPKATFQAPNPKKDPRAKRRLYTRAQAEGIVRIAMEEGLIDPAKRKRIGDTKFTERVTKLFRELQK